MPTGECFPSLEAGRQADRQPPIRPGQLTNLMLPKLFPIGLAVAATALAATGKWGQWKDICRSFRWWQRAYMGGWDQCVAIPYLDLEGCPLTWPERPEDPAMF